MIKIQKLALLMAASLLVQAAPAKPPNVIIILADDLGYQDVGFNGCVDITTPNIDSIARNGIRFTNGYVSYAVCGPSRAGLMTGRYQGRFGFRVNPSIDPTNPEIGVPQVEKNLAEALKPVGYTSMVIGKWHLGAHPTQHPLERGFDEFYGFLSGGHDYFPEKLTLNSLDEVNEAWAWYRTKIMRNRTRVDTDEYLTNGFSNEAVDFVARHRDRPFFLYLSYNAPHAPLQATAKYLNRFPNIKDKRRKTYAAMVSALDDGVGRLLDRLRELKLDEQTVVYFLSDNGGPESANASDNGPLRDGKGSFHEGGVRVPFVVQWPGTLPKGVDYDHPVISLDMFATAVALAEAPVSPERPLDGVNLMPYLTGKDEKPPHDALFWSNVNGGDAMRTGQFKLIRSREDMSYRMYELKDDIGERDNRASAYPEQLKSDSEALENWSKDLKPAGFPGLGQEWWKKDGARK